MEDPRIGQVLDDRFRIIERLAAGGTGVVYRAEELGAAERVAIKFLHQSTADSSVHRGRFEREAAAMSRLTHPNVASIIGYSAGGERPYLVMEMVEGDSLRRLLQAGPLPPRRAALLARQILAGLESAHEGGVVHRDLKPGNVVIARESGEDRVKILDFGVAKLLGQGSTALSVVTQQPLGTPDYMSPEQAKSEAVDHRADIYSVGVMLYEMVTGRRPFAAETGFAVLRQHVEDAPRPPRRFAPQLSAELETVILRAMRKDPAERWQSAAEMAASLAEVPELARPEPEPAPRSGRPWRVAAASLALLGASAGALWLAAANSWLTPPAWLPWPRGPLEDADRKISASVGAGVAALASAAAEAPDAGLPPPPPWSPPPAAVKLGPEPAPPILELRGVTGRLAGDPFAPGFVLLEGRARGPSVQISALPPDRGSPCAGGSEPEGQRSLVISLPARGAPAFSEAGELRDVEGATIEARARGERTALEGRWALELTRVDAGAGVAEGRIRVSARGGTWLRGRFRGVYCPGPRAHLTEPPEVNGAVWDPDRAPAPAALSKREAAGAFGRSELRPAHASLRGESRDGWVLSFFAEEPADPCADLDRSDVGLIVLLPFDVLHEGYELSALLDTAPGAAPPRVGLQPAPDGERGRPDLVAGDVLALRIDAVTGADLRGRIYTAAADRRRSLFTGAFRAVDCR